ncbi:YceI family protein [Flavisericum labens]|uniref:YceI family protein n=1 Tax=Flavisericum labens TaxID=3377112 RepID=UPI00387B66C2
MKKKFVTLLFITALSVTVMGCKDKAKEAKTGEAEAPASAEVVSETYKADLDESTVEWKGFKPTGEHFGTIAIERGSFDVTNGNIVGGSFIIDMKSIVVKDMPADDKMNIKLTGHLKSPDFFDVDTHPSAGFTITGIQEVNGKTMLSGNLTIKDIKNNITIPVSVSHAGDQLTLESETFTIDRSKWNVKYGSKSFFDNLGDKFINDDIELKVSVKATKA